jgi:hypothetical protein
LLPEKVGDGYIIVSGVFERLEGVSIAALLCDRARLEFFEKFSIIGRVDENCDTAMVLGSCSDESDATDVDLLDCLRHGHIDLGHGILERIEVAYDEVNLIDVLIC